MAEMGQERRISAGRNISALPPRADVGADIVEPPVPTRDIVPSHRSVDAPHHRWPPVRLEARVTSVHEKNYIRPEKRCFARKHEKTETAPTDGLGG